MSQRVSCPHCEKPLRVPETLLGRSVKCPGCGGSFTAEAATAAEPVAPPPARREEEGFTERPPPRPAEDEDRYDDDRGGDDDDFDRRPRRRRRRRRRRYDSVEASLLGPGIGLIVVGVLAVLAGLANFMLMAGGAAGNPGMRNDPGYRGGYYAGTVSCIIWGCIVTAGGVCMLIRKSHGLAKAGAITALLPCSGCCILGMPFGIWALMILGDPDVYNTFD